MASILIASDTPEIARTLDALFTEAGYATCQAPVRKQHLVDGGEATDLVIIDATRDGRKGVRLASQLRSRSQVGIILLHDGESDPDPADALEEGADDVVVTPFRRRELLARVNSLLRRIQMASPDGEEEASRRGIAFNGWWLDLEHRQLVATATNRAVPLTAAEYDMLMVFLQNPCRVLTREHISLFSQGRPHSATVRTLDAQVARLRKKLAAHSDAVQYIKSVRGVGYIFCIRTRDIH